MRPPALSERCVGPISTQARPKSAMRSKSGAASAINKESTSLGRAWLFPPHSGTLGWSWRDVPAGELELDPPRHVGPWVPAAGIDCLRRLAGAGRLDGVVARLAHRSRGGEVKLDDTPAGGRLIYDAGPCAPLPTLILFLPMTMWQKQSTALLEGRPPPGRPRITPRQAPPNGDVGRPKPTNAWANYHARRASWFVCGRWKQQLQAPPVLS